MISPTPMKPTNTETSPLTAWDMYEETIVSTPPLQSKFVSVVKSPLTNPHNPSPLPSIQIKSSSTNNPIEFMENTISHQAIKLEGIEAEIST